MSYRPPEPLGPTHELGAFICASAEQTDRLVRHAHQSMASGTARVFVVVPSEGRDVVAYDAWTMAQIELADAADFHRHLIPEFETRPTDELHLVLLLEDIERTLQAEHR